MWEDYHITYLAFGDLMGSEVDPRSEVVKSGWKTY